MAETVDDTMLSHVEGSDEMIERLVCTFTSSTCTRASYRGPMKFIPRITT